MCLESTNWMLKRWPSSDGTDYKDSLQMWRVAPSEWWLDFGDWLAIGNKPSHHSSQTEKLEWNFDRMIWGRLGLLLYDINRNHGKSKSNCLQPTNSASWIQHLQMHDAIGKPTNNEIDLPCSKWTFDLPQGNSSNECIIQNTSQTDPPEVQQLLWPGWI